MGSIYRRGNKLYFGFKDATGKWRYRSSGYEVGQEKKATKLLEQLEAQVEAEQRHGTTRDRGPVTVARFARAWLRERDDLGIADTKNDRSRLNKHILPVIGEQPIADVRTRLIRDLVRKWRADGKLAPRTLRNVYGVLHTLFRDATIEDLCDSNPCVLSSKELGPNEDKDPEWRSTAVYDRDELVKLVSSDAVPPDRQVVYALMGLAGLRHGEMAGLHWRNYDTTREPLGKLVIARSYDKASTKTKRPREVPVHPALADVLAEWRDQGFPEMLGRSPEPDDLLVPSREAAMRSRHHSRNGFVAKIWPSIGVG